MGPSAASAERQTSAADPKPAIPPSESKTPVVVDSLVCVADTFDIAAAAAEIDRLSFGLCHRSAISLHRLANFNSQRHAVQSMAPPRCHKKAWNRHSVAFEFVARNDEEPDREIRSRMALAPSGTTSNARAHTPRGLSMNKFHQGARATKDDRNRHTAIPVVYTKHRENIRTTSPFSSSYRNSRAASPGRSDPRRYHRRDLPALASRRLPCRSWPAASRGR